MATYLSRLAKYYIADFLNHREVVTMTAEWREMSEVYHSGGIQLHRMPPPEYAMTTEFDNCLRKDVSPQALEYLFTEGPQAVYWYRLPTGFLSTIVELFLQRPTETPLRPVLCVCDFSTPSATLLWQELYVDFFPCGHCERIQVGGAEEVGRRRPWDFHDSALSDADHNGIERDEAMEAHINKTPIYVIEVFHIGNPASGQVMTIELWFDSFGHDVLERFAPFPIGARVQKRTLRSVKIYHAGCENTQLASLWLGSPARRNKLPSELMLEVYCFLPRYWLDASQLVCKDWRNSVKRSAVCLPLHALTVDFKHADLEWEREYMGCVTYGAPLDHEWEMKATNYSQCLGYVNCREFRFVNAQSPAHSSAVIRRHLRNAFVQRMSFNVGKRDFEWSAQMLLRLGGNTVVDGLDTPFMREECLTLFGRFEEGLVCRNVQKLNLTVTDPLLKALIDRHSFFSSVPIQQLHTLELDIRHTSTPLESHWIPALFELSACRRFAIRYQPVKFRHNTVDATRISSALLVMLQDFETSGRDIAVDHFSLTSLVEIPSLVANRKPVFEAVPAPDVRTFRRCNVYYFETEDRKDCLTLFVPPEDGHHWTDIHVKRGKVTDFT